MRAGDSETLTLRNIVGSLDALPREASERVVSYLAARYRAQTPLDRLLKMAEPKPALPGPYLMKSSVR